MATDELGTRVVLQAPVMLATFTSVVKLLAFGGQVVLLQTLEAFVEPHGFTNPYVID